MPCKFDENVIIYDEGDDVPEVYFIMEGTIRVGFRTPTLNYTVSDLLSTSEKTPLSVISMFMQNRKWVCISIN